MRTSIKKYGLWMGLLLGTALGAFAVPVTFQVNMSVQASLGSFDPAADLVFVSGSFNTWSTVAGQLTQSQTDTNLWVGTFDVTGTEGSTQPYKFIKLTSSLIWEGSVGAGGAQNRSFTLATTDQTLPVVFFNNISNTVVNISPVTFQVNMEIQIARGNFDPTSGTVVVAGGFNSWNTSESVLTNSVADTNIWAGTFYITNAPGYVEGYRFVMNGSTWEALSADRTFVVTNVPLTLPLVFFGNVTNAVTLTNTLTFQINMGVQIARGTFDPASGSVVVAGDPINSWSASASPLTQSPTDTNTWTGTFDVISTAGSSVLYKFVLNGSTWESIANRTYLPTTNAAETLPLAFFDNVNNLGALSMGPLSGGQTTFSWTAGPLVRLQNTTNLAAAWQNVPNTEGQGSATIPVGGTQIFFRLVGP